MLICVDVTGDETSDGLCPLSSRPVATLRGGSRNSVGVLSDVRSTVIDLLCAIRDGGGANWAVGLETALLAAWASEIASVVLLEVITPGLGGRGGGLGETLRD